MNEAAVLRQEPRVVSLMARAAFQLQLGVLVQQVHQASWVLGSGDDDLLLDWCVLSTRCKVALQLLGLLSILTLALLDVALEAREGLRQILERKILQEHSETHTDVGGACSTLGPRN